MIWTLLTLSGAAGFAGAWASRAERFGFLLVLCGGVWVSGVLLINKGTKDRSVDPSQVSGLIDLGMTLILLGLAMATAIALGRLMRGRVRPVIAGLVGAGVTLFSLMAFYGLTFGFIG